MTKIAEIKNCSQCPHQMPCNVGGGFCEHPKVKDALPEAVRLGWGDYHGTMPEWCPLPNLEDYAPYLEV